MNLDRFSRYPLTFGSTQAGMVVGFKIDGRSQRVIGIDVTGHPGKTREMVKQIAENTAKLVELDMPIMDSDVVLNEDYAYPSYGIPSEETLDAIRLCGRLEGMITDPVYEGKSMQALIDMIRTGKFEPGSKVLYVHLGGVPALSGYSSLFRE